MTINILSSEIINQIAAGEVIENPAAIIKELIENSIDAKAIKIDIEIEDAGIKKIIIIDNGNGILKEDLLKAPIRHATSKIKNFDDLYNIKTMGFRGEALASIFSISKAKIISKTNDCEAYEISYKDKTKIFESACKKGTTIVAENIFYNTPARKKYLKSENLELKNIVDVVNRYAIIHYDKKITLKHNFKFLINKPVFKSLEENLYYIINNDLKGNLIEFENEKNGIKISGFIGKPSSITYSHKKNQYIYINKRYVKSKLISDAIYDGFKTNLMDYRHPFFILEIDIDPEIIDVNIHPSKIEIKFENELEIYDFIRNTISEIFQRQETFKSFESQKFSEKNINLSKQFSEIIPLEKSKKTLEKSYFTQDSQKHFEVKEDIINYQKSIVQPINKNVVVTEEISKDRIEYGPLYDILNEYKIIGQINKTYIIIETQNEMILIDQHAAEEKFNYEMFRENLNNKKQTQVLLKPEIVQLSLSENLLYTENLKLFEMLGFKSEKFGNNEIIVREVPINLRKQILSPQLIKEILYEISIDKKFITLEDDKLEKLASMSCRKAIKAGYEMTIPEIKDLIEKLRRLKEPFNCPHGRPALLQYKFKDLEKKFSRIV